MKIAHISDTHFGTEIPEVAAAIKPVITREQPDIALLSGDITQRARRRQFEDARNFMNDLGVRYFSIPGNHDIPLFDVVSRFMTPYRLYKEIFGAREFIDVIGHIALIGLDATNPLRHTRGKLDLKDIESRLSIVRKQIGDKGILLVSVHQPLITAWKEDRTEELIGERETAELFTRYEVDAVLSGHVHVPLICTSEKAYPDLSRRFIHIGAGSATSYRTREGKPNSFNMVSIDPETASIGITQYDYDARKKAFHPLPALIFTRTGNGWFLR